MVQELLLLHGRSQKLKQDISKTRKHGMALAKIAA